MTPKLTRSLRLGAAVAAGATLLAGAAAAADGADYYKGKNVTYVVATAAGGGYDFYGRLVARYMQNHLPGSTFVVRNVPGAGHIIGANLLYAAKPDGETIGTFNTGLIFSQLLGRQGVRFDLAKMTWIGKAASDPRVIMAAAQTDLKTLDDLRTARAPVRFASAGVGSSAYNDTMMLSKVLGWNMKLILGYDGTDAELAMRRGEIDASVGSQSSAELFVKNGYGRYIAQIGGKAAPGVPLLSEIVTERNAKAVVALVGSQAEIARFTAGPPGIPADRAKTLVEAYRKAMEDSELQAQAIKADRPVDPLYGEELARKVREALDQPPEIVAMVADILNIVPPASKVATALSAVSPDGREIAFKHGANDVKSKISAARTKITIGGKPGAREALKAGMACEIDYKPGGDNEPVTIDCK